MKGYTSIEIILKKGNCLGREEMTWSTAVFPGPFPIRGFETSIEKGGKRQGKKSG